MASGRYNNTNTLDGHYYETSKFPDKTTLDNISSIQVVAAQFDRLDVLAHKHLGNGEYWWVIALMNDIDWAYDIEEGQILRIPIDVSDVLKYF